MMVKLKTAGGTDIATEIQSHCSAAPAGASGEVITVPVACATG
jgi:hypothetical protein